MDVNDRLTQHEDLAVYAESSLFNRLAAAEERKEALVVQKQHQRQEAQKARQRRFNSKHGKHSSLRQFAPQETRFTENQAMNAFGCII